MQRVRTPSSPVRERERERERDKPRERERERGRDNYPELLLLFLKLMTGALAPFSYLVKLCLSVKVGYLAGRTGCRMN